MVWGVQAIFDAVTLSAHEFASWGPASLRLALLMALRITILRIIIATISKNTNNRGNINSTN